MKPNSQERGQALILIAFAAVGLFALTALAIDGSRVFSDRRHAQNAADTAVLAAALAKARGGDYAAAAISRASSNGYANDSDSSVEVHLCSDPGVACQGLPAGANPSEFIQVKIISTIPTTFGRVIGRESVTSAVEAVARVQGTSSSSSTIGTALVGLRQTGCGICSGGNVDLKVVNSGVFSNSTDNHCVPPPIQASMDFTGNGTYNSQNGFIMPPGGALCAGGNSTVTGTAQVGAPIPYPPNINIPAPNITCSVEAPPMAAGATVIPAGHYSNQLVINFSGSYTFEAGNYCFDNGVSINGTTTITADNVNFLISGGEFKTGGVSTLNCNNMLVYGAGGTGIHLGGNSNTTCTGVTFYMQSGDVTWNGNFANVLAAPTSGTYQGLLIYMPYSNPASPLKINGNSGNQLTGSIIAPNAEIKISGDSGSSGYDTQIIGNFITLAGNSNTTINYNPNAQYNPPGSPTIQLTE